MGENKHNKTLTIELNYKTFFVKLQLTGTIPNHNHIISIVCMTVAADFDASDFCENADDSERVVMMMMMLMMMMLMMMMMMMTMPVDNDNEHDAS